MNKGITILAFALLIIPDCWSQNVGIGTTAPTDNLHTTGTVRFQGMTGLGNRLLYVDSAGRVAPPANTDYYANNTPVAIPDNGCGSGTGASSTISVSGFFTAISGSNIGVRVDISHPATADLALYLVAPNGTTLGLSGYAGSGANYRGTIFQDDAADYTAMSSSPFAGRYRPSGYVFPSCGVMAGPFNFSSLSAMPFVPNGNWTLRVFDNATGSVGTLNNWQITFSGPNGFGTTGASGPVPYFKDGALALSSIVQSGPNIGIGTSTPNAKLEVAGTVKATNIIVTGGNPTAGKVLTAVSASGDATWATPPTPPAAGAGFRVTISGAVASAPINTYTTVPFNDETSNGMFDDGLAFNAGTHTYTAPSAGVYQFNAMVTVNNPPGGTSYAQLEPQVNNGGFNWPSVGGYIQSGSSVSLSMSFTLKLAASDVVRMFLYNGGSSSPLTFSSFFGRPVRFQASAFTNADGAGIDNRPRVVATFFLYCGLPRLRPVCLQLSVYRP